MEGSFGPTRSLALAVEDEEGDGGARSREEKLDASLSSSASSRASSRSGGSRASSRSGAEGKDDAPPHLPTLIRQSSADSLLEAIGADWGADNDAAEEKDTRAESKHGPSGRSGPGRGV